MSASLPEEPLAAIRLRALRADDLRAIYRWHQDEDTVRTLGNVFRFRGEAEAIGYMERWLVSSDKEVRLGIEQRDSARLIGMTSLLEIDQINRSASLHLMLGEGDARGKGFGPIATRLLLKHAFADLGLLRVGLQVLEDNAAAQSIYEKAGFHVEGQLRSAVFKAGARHNIILMSILADEYAAPR